MQLLVLLMQIHVARTARSRKYELECIVGLLVCYAVMLITVLSSTDAGFQVQNQQETMGLNPRCTKS